MPERIDIERALDALTSDEGGMIFQGLAVVLAKMRYPELVACERKNDLGLDAFANVALSPDGRAKGMACSLTGTFEKVHSDARKVQANYSEVSLLLFYTPEKVSQPKKAEWAQKIDATFGFELVVISREDIIASLQIPDNAHLCATHLRMHVPIRKAGGRLAEGAQAACAALSADWAANPRLAGKPRIALNAVTLDQHGTETRELFATPHLLELLLQGRRLILEAPAGRGKTTTLVGLAQLHATGNRPGIPILIDLPGWLKSGLDILEHLARMPQFRAQSISADDLACLRQSTPILFLLNGWNEIAEMHSQDAVDALRALERSFPAAGILVATRTHHVMPPLPGSSRIRLLPLTSGQRLDYLNQALGHAKAAALQSKLNQDRALDDLTRTPFILSEVTTIFRSGAEIPRTKLGLLEAVITLAEHSEEHRSHLQSPPLRGTAADYLGSLAVELTARGDVLLGDIEARTICYSSGERLRRAGQIAVIPEPADVLTVLCSHHLLERVNYPGTRFRFEHQQFQEYYAALMLREALWKAAASRDGAQRQLFTESYVNEPRWEEPLRMVAESLGDSQADIQAASMLVEEALAVDPVLAAQFYRLAGLGASSDTHRHLSNRLRALYTAPGQPYQQYALAGMIATGSDSFADILLPLLTHSDQQLRLATYRSWTEFHTTSLGPDWRQMVAEWAEQYRMEFVSELVLHHGNTEPALAFARSDPSIAVRIAALEGLAWTGRRREVNEILQELSDVEFTQALQKLDVRHLDPPLLVRAKSSFRAQLTQTTDPRSRIRIVHTLAALGDAEAPVQLRDEIAKLPADIVKELSDHSLRSLLDVVRSVHPDWVSEWVMDQIISGILWRESWQSLVPLLPKTISDDLLKRASTEDLQYGLRGGLGLLAAKADAALARDVFTAFRDHHRALMSNPMDQRMQAIDSQLKHLFASISGVLVIEGLSEILADTPRDDELLILARRFSRSSLQAGSQAPCSEIPELLREQLRRYLKAAVSMVASQYDPDGEIQAMLSAALAEICNSADLQDLVALARSDLDRARERREAVSRGDHTARQRGATSWSGWHTQSIVLLAGTQAERALLELLLEPEYEVDAAWALRAIARKDLGTRPATGGRFGWPSRDYARLNTDPPEWKALFDETRRVKYTATITQRMTDLLTESSHPREKVSWYHHRLKELAKVLAALDPFHSASFILDIAELPGRYDGWTRIDLLEALAFGHAVLPTDRILAILDPVIDQLRQQGLSNDGANLFHHLLCILPLVDDPARGIARIRELVQSFRLRLYDQGPMLMAIGQCRDPEALLLLREMATSRNEHFASVAREWVAAIAHSTLPGANELLLSFVATDVTDGVGDLRLPDFALDFLASKLAQLAQADAVVAARILRLCSLPGLEQRRQILAKIIAYLDSPEAILAGLDLLDDSSPNSIPYALFRLIEDTVLEKRRSRPDSQSYRLVARDANTFRMRLLEMTHDGSRRARSAYRLLGQIEEWRLEYGRPTFEPRHPALESGCNWPPLPVAE